MANLIGSVRILKDRVYPLDATNRDNIRQEAYVSEGVYYVFREMDAVFWIMEGVLNESPRSPRKIGDGMFTITKEGDAPTNIEVKFPSKVYGIDEFKQFLEKDSLCIPGPYQRLQFNVKLED